MDTRYILGRGWFDILIAGIGIIKVVELKNEYQNKETFIFPYFDRLPLFYSSLFSSNFTISLLNAGKSSGVRLVTNCFWQTNTSSS